MRFCPRCGNRYGDEFNVCTEDGTKLQELPPERAADPFVGTVVDNRYRIEKLIGEAAWVSSIRSRTLPSAKSSQ